MQDYKGNRVNYSRDNLIIQFYQVFQDGTSIVDIHDIGNFLSGWTTIFPPLASRPIVGTTA